MTIQTLLKTAPVSDFFDKQVIDIIKSLNDPYPYIRGLICEIGFEKAFVDFKQPARKRGFTKIIFTHSTTMQ